jgi:nucleotide-binding universal stress UspA family protein
MAENHRNAPIIVGVDGSKTAVRAAIWAADEAIGQDTTLLLVNVVDADRDDQETAMAEARHVLTEAWEAVVASGKPVKIETDILHGDAAIQLVEASGTARMVCVGHKGTHDSGQGRRGATATQVAQTATSTAAVIRHRKEPSPFHQWIIAVLDESPESRQVLQTALDEATLRKSPVLALTSSSTPRRRQRKGAASLRETLDRYLDEADDADIKICVLPAPEHMFNFLKQSASIDQLVVVGANNTDMIRELVTPRVARILRKSNCSMMFVRGGAEV